MQARASRAAPPQRNTPARATPSVPTPHLLMRHRLEHHCRPVDQREAGAQLVHGRRLPGGRAGRRQRLRVRAVAGGG
jgi:hypothetical protein